MPSDKWFFGGELFRQAKCSRRITNDRGCSGASELGCEEHELLRNDLNGSTYTHIHCAILHVNLNIKVQLINFHWIMTKALIHFFKDLVVLSFPHGQHLVHSADLVTTH